jgi:uncharacterized protein YndB with AHSA1/START domain
VTHPVIHSTFTIEHTYNATVARVFHAFSDPQKKRRWFAEGKGFVIESYNLDFKVGGFESCRFRFGDGPLMTLESVCLDIVPEQRIIFAYAMTIGGAPMSSSLGTMEFMPGAGGTRLRFTENSAFVDGNDGSAGRREGSVGMLEKLAEELEAHP